jgi:hypothetical protein
VTLTEFPPEGLVTVTIWIWVTLTETQRLEFGQRHRNSLGIPAHLVGSAGIMSARWLGDVD